MNTFSVLSKALFCLSLVGFKRSISNASRFEMFFFFRRQTSTEKTSQTLKREWVLSWNVSQTHGSNMTRWSFLQGLLRGLHRFFFLKTHAKLLYFCCSSASRTELQHCWVDKLHSRDSLCKWAADKLVGRTDLYTRCELLDRTWLDP